MKSPLACAALLAALTAVGCGEVMETPAGARVEVAVRALSLPGMDESCVDLAVSNGVEVVWSRGDATRTRLGADQSRTGGASGAPDTATLCSGAYGDGPGGDLSFVAPCDASSDSDPTRPGVQNDVTLWVDGLYKDGADLGDWRDPCPGGCTLAVDCAADADTRVEFNVTVLRAARQGFFDVAVSFDDIFCSAKLDTCHLDPDAPEAPGAPIRLLFGADGARHWTAVLGFACTAGPDADATHLLYGPVEVACGDVVFALDPAGPPGNNDAVAGDDALRYGVYRGAEELMCGAASCRKVYWNLAVSLDDLAALGGACTLTATATAHDPASSSFVGGLPDASGLAWPYLEVAATLTEQGAASCQHHALDAPQSAVTTGYRGDLGGVAPALAQCASFSGVEPAAPTGAPGCPGSGPPEVGGVTPSGAGAGETVTFSGAGFGAAEGSVAFAGDVPAEVVTWSNDAVTVVVPEGGLSGEVVITRADGSVAEGETYFAYTDVEAAPIAALNTHAYSIFDVDFDGLGNAYYAEFISGVDRMHRVAPDGTKTSYTGIADYNLGFGAASWDGTLVSGSYSGTTPRGVLLVDGNNVMQYLYSVAHATCTTWSISGYALCGPMDPEWGFDGYFYAGNLLGSGDVSRYNVTTAPQRIVQLPAFVVSVATLSNQRMWAAAGKVLYEVDKQAETATPVHTFATNIVHISASSYHRRVYVEVVGGTVHAVSYDGAASVLLSGFASPGFITVGPDFKLYRVQGRVNAASTITAYDLPAPTP